MEIEADDRLFGFINEHINDDPVKLRLKYHNSQPWVDYAITHLQCLAKAGRKFTVSATGETFHPRLLLSPLSIEQATSADIAMFHRSLIKPGDKILDMTGGVGIDTMAMASVDNTMVTSCEISPLLAAAARCNFAGYDNITTVEGDSVGFLEETDRHFDVIFIDPARRGSQGQRVYNLHDCTPDLTALLPLMLEKSDRVIAKLSPMLDVSQTLRDLPSTSSIYAVDNGTECKELLAIITRDFDGEPEIIARNRDLEFRFLMSHEHAAPLRLSSPAVGSYLLEPAPAIMKAAPFKLLSERFDIGKLSANTHLYISDTPVTDFPGNQLKIVDIIEFSSSEIKRLHSRYPLLNITARNFPMAVPDLYKKLRCKQGGNLRMFAVTAAPDRKLMIVTE